MPDDEKEPLGTPDGGGSSAQAADRSRRLETVADVRTIYDESPAWGRLTFETHHHGLELWGTVKPNQKADILSPEAVLKIFGELGVTGDVNQAALRDFCAAANRGETAEHVVLALGKEPQKGMDEHVEFLIRPTSDKPRYEKDEHGNIDYYNLHLFDNAMPKDLIARTCPPRDGVPGLSVTGDILPSTKGGAFAAPPRAGRDVREETEGGITSYYARMEGRVVYENNEISICDTYEVKGDVDYNTGHINFVGHVSVTGDVLNDFNVRGEKSVSIKGNVGVCRLESGGDITTGGVSGDDKGVIICGGNLQSRYLNAVYVECKKNIAVKNEIVNCRVKCGGCIDVNMGSIVGGECMALAGIEARGFGSEVGVKTRIITGFCYEAIEKMKKLHEELDPVTIAIEKLSKKLEPLAKNPRAILGLSPKDREIYREMAMKLNEFIPRQAKLKEEIDIIKKDVEHRANPMINVRKTLDRGVELDICGTRESILERIVRPVTIIKNSRKDLLRYIPLRTLHDHVREVEREICRIEDEEEKRRRELERKKMNE